jgi:hypothetical protein
MNKKILPIVGVLILIVGAYGAYRVYKHFARLSATPSVQTATGTEQPSAVSSLKDLISKGIAQSCTFSNEGMTGSVYMSGGKVREDFDVTVDNKTMKSHVIVMENTIYNWSDGQTTGIKMAYDPNATPAATSATSSSKGSFDTNASLNYKCSAWTVDASKFTLPAGVTFQTFAVPSVGTTGTTVPGAAPSQCSYCNNLSGDDKTQCLAALKCN